MFVIILIPLVGAIGIGIGLCTTFKIIGYLEKKNEKR